MAGRDDAIALYTELEGLNVPDKASALNDLKVRGFPSTMNISGKPSYFDDPSNDQEKEDKSAFVFALSQYIHRVNGN